MKKTFLRLLIFSMMIAFWSCNQETSKTETKEEKVNFSSVDPLPSWNDGATKQSIVDFVTKVTTEGSSDFVPITDRIATFDNDGNLWAEQPVYFQVQYALDQIKVMAEDHPEWANEEPYKSVINNDVKAVLASGKKGLMQIMATTHAGMTIDEFDDAVAKWLSATKHPRFNQPYNTLIYQPMLELLDYLRANGFKTFIVSGGGIEFMRVWTEEAYGIPTDQVVGSSIKTEFDYNNGDPVIRRLAEINFIDDKEGKPVGINSYIGKKPIFASGNSDGDLQMMQYADSNSLPSFMLYLHHTDAEREWAYDRESHIGQLDKGLDEAEAKGWTVIDMKNDWNKIFPFDQ